ncbi:hypothetical protein [Nocardia sp. NPDC127526]|uniref:hypothetical protein n=1 Tax=Nocardia sp. NPDC127526 TaxID=3345393 RepID=UPI00362D0992
MSDRRDDSMMIEGRVAPGLGASRALHITFSVGPDEPLAVGVQGAGNGVGARAAILFGLQNVGVGRHLLTYTDGSVVWVDSHRDMPTVVSRGDGAAIGKIVRAETSTAVGATAGTLFHFVPDPEHRDTADLFHLLVLDRMGEEAGRLDVVRTVAGWSAGRLANGAGGTFLWWDRTGPPLRVPILGTRLVIGHALDKTERDVLLAACVDIALGLRPYVGAMK